MSSSSSSSSSTQSSSSPSLEIISRDEKRKGRIFEGTATVTPFRPEVAGLKHVGLFESPTNRNDNCEETTASETSNHKRLSHQLDLELEVAKLKAQTHALEERIVSNAGRFSESDENFTESMRSQIQSLRSERLGLLKELQESQREWQVLMEEKQRIMRAVNCTNENYVETIVSKLGSKKKKAPAKQTKPTKNKKAKSKKKKKSKRKIVLPDCLTKADVDAMSCEVTLEICRKFKHHGLSICNTKQGRADQVKKLFEGKEKGYVLYIDHDV